jgi:predicted permease
VLPFVDWRVIAAVAVIAVAAGLLAGVAPAVLAARYDDGTALRSGQRATHQRTRLRAALLVAQAALSVLLLVGAALFVRSLNHVRDFHMGYDAAPVVLVTARPRGTPMDTARGWALADEILRRAKQAPGVENAASVTSVPVWNTSSTNLYVQGIDSVRRLGQFTYQVTSPEFFQTFGTRIVRGRGFSGDDIAGAAPVAVVSESMARVLWPGRDAIGQCMHVRSETTPCTTIVGIAEDIVQQQNQLTDAARYQYYMPVAQFRLRGPSTRFMVRVTGDPDTQAEQLRRWLQPIMPGASYVTVQPLRDMLESVRRSWELGARLFAAFGLLALFVAGIGLYGVLSYNVTQRFHELGIRVALGAQARDILRLVAGDGARLVLAGVILGSALALAAGRWVEPLLFQESAHDPTIYVAVALIMVFVALAASAFPARRAIAADPNEALRAD